MPFQRLVFESHYGESIPTAGFRHRVNVHIRIVGSGGQPVRILGLTNAPYASRAMYLPPLRHGCCLYIRKVIARALTSCALAAAPQLRFGNPKAARASRSKAETPDYPLLRFLFAVVCVAITVARDALADSRPCTAVTGGCLNRHARSMMNGSVCRFLHPLSFGDTDFVKAPPPYLWIILDVLTITG